MTPMRDYAMVKSMLIEDVSRWLPKTWSESSFSVAQAAAEGWTADQVAVALQVGALYKKLAPDGQSESAIKATLEKFSALNSSVSFRPPHTEDSESMIYQLHIFRDELWKLFDFEIDGRNFDFAFMQDHFATGPGASRLANSRNFYSKMFDSNHSYTNPYILALFRAAIAGSETWTSAYKHWEKAFRPVMVRGNSLFTVKKSTEISRTCCTEPLLNMLFQKALGSWFEERLASKLGISLDSQPDVNRALTCRGSIDGTYGTIDLSSASDSIAMELCEWSLPPTILKWVRLFRSEIVRLPSGQEVPLRMVSTMGNGFTFPLETAIFACALRAVYISKGIKPSLWRNDPTLNGAVFGDDIVVLRDCYESLVTLLKRLGFAVNESKSFNSGSFRESCGYDMWEGRNIRPVHIESLETPQDVYSSFNRLSRWSAENGVPIGRTLYHLSRMAWFLPIPFSEVDDGGFKVPVICIQAQLSGNGWTRYKKLVPVTTAEKVPKDLESAKRRGYKDYNPYGWEVAFLGRYAHNPVRTSKQPDSPIDTGAIRLGADLISRRPYQGEVLSRVYRSSAIPFWDWFGEQDTGRFGRCSYPRWQAGVAQIF